MTEAETVRFELIKPKTNNRIGMKMVDAGTGKDLSRGNLMAALKNSLQGSGPERQRAERYAAGTREPARGMAPPRQQPRR